jgi:hypothetical protein
MYDTFPNPICERPGGWRLAAPCEAPSLSNKQHRLLKQLLLVSIHACS